MVDTEFRHTESTCATLALLASIALHQPASAQGLILRPEALNKSILLEELTERAKLSLDIVAGARNDQQLSPFPFRIEGHADPRGEDQYNLLLSQARAERVVDYLVRHHGIAPIRLQAIGLGESQVLRPDKPANPENRRVTIVHN